MTPGKAAAPALRQAFAYLDKQHKTWHLGCRGNGVLNCGHAVVRRLVLDSLQHWAREFHFDGFAFLNAEALTHGETRAASECCAG